MVDVLSGADISLAVPVFDWAERNTSNRARL